MSDPQNTASNSKSSSKIKKINLEDLDGNRRGSDDGETGQVAEGVFTDDPGSTIQAANSTFDMSTTTPPVAHTVTDDPFEGGSVRIKSASVATPSFQIQWSGDNVPNFYQGRRGQRVIAIVDHIIEGSLNSAASWFTNPKAEASSHYGIGKDGKILQFVRLENGAWGNGIINNPDTSIDWLVQAQANKINPNFLTVSIEHEGRSGEPFTEQMYQATLWLHRYLIQNFSIQVDRNHIIGHYQIDSVSRANCPGRAFPFDRLMQDLAGFVPPMKPRNEPPTPSSGGVGATDVSGRTEAVFGPGTVNTPGAYVRVRPGFGPEAMVLRKLDKGTVLPFIAYSDAGPAFNGGNRWYQINEADGGGWIHSTLIS